MRTQEGLSLPSRSAPVAVWRAFRGCPLRWGMVQAAPGSQGAFEGVLDTSPDWSALGGIGWNPFQPARPCRRTSLNGLAFVVGQCCRRLYSRLALCSKPLILLGVVGLERVMGIEPTWPAWKAGALPLSYTRAVAGSNSSRRRRSVNARGGCKPPVELRQKFGYPGWGRTSG
jgi:hypothetical protein